MDFKGKSIHVIGVGGSGMFPLALLLCEAGARVRGVDRNISDNKHSALVKAGAEILLDGKRARSHDFTAPKDWLCIASAAIPSHHPDLRAARRLGVAVLNRSETLAALLINRETVCIAGSHGKSTTTAMLAWIFSSASNADIGYMIGADLDNALPARAGSPSAPFFLEACEAYGALSNWVSSHAILTNVDDEHVEQYGCSDQLNAAFVRFLSRVSKEGVLVVNGDDPRALALAQLSACKIITCGLTDGNDLRAVEQSGTLHILQDGSFLGVLNLAVAGRHNTQNALLAIGIALELGLDASQILSALASFRGLKRRLQLVSDSHQPRVIDDFAHHPAEISAGLQSLRKDTLGSLIAIVEPQLHSRVTRLADDFVAALSPADKCFILPVAALGESSANGCGNQALTEAFSRAGRAFDAVADLDDLLKRLSDTVTPADTLVIMGGHTISGFAQQLVARLAITKQAQATGPSVLFGPQTPAPPDLLTIVADHVRNSPAAAAIEMGHRSLSYSQLWHRAAALASRLQGAGVGGGDVVGVYLKPNVDRAAALLATLRLGAVYLPLDPALPEQRLAFMLCDASVRAVIVNAASPSLPYGAPAFVSSDLLEVESSDIIDTFSSNPSTHLAYLIYTSGTTGAPKGVDVTRGAISNYAVAACAAFKLTSQSRMSLVSAFGFDVNIGDIAVAWAAGACLVMPTEIEGRPGTPMGNFIAEKRLSHLSLTPSALNAVPAGDYPDLKSVIVAGETCSPALARAWAHNERAFINAYGPTEATVEATFAYCDGSDPVSIGRPFDNMGLCILDAALNVIEVGCEGEVCLFGAGLAKGYRNQPELNATQFPTLPPSTWSPDPAGLWIYRTGDRARINADGCVIFCGRMDDQFKILGHRVDPSEVESALCALPDIQDCAVTLVKGKHARLAAHVVLSAGVSSLDLPAVRAALAQSLPQYMQPSILLPVPFIPLTLNGKRDRAALVVPASALAPHTSKAPATDTEKRILELLADVVPTLPIAGIRENLFDAGMDSLDLVALLAAIEKAYGVSLDIAFPPGSETIEFLSLSVDVMLAAPSMVPSKKVVRTRLADILLPHLAMWPGRAAKHKGLLRHIPENTATTALYWMFQAGSEFSALDSAVTSAGIKVFGTRSGHLLYEYTETNLAAICTLMADEIESLHVSGPIHLGGNCQGGMIMLHVAKELGRRGQTLGAVILMEQGRFPTYQGQVALLFGEGSYLNPYTLLGNPDTLFQAAYPRGYSVEIIK